MRRQTCRRCHGHLITGTDDHGLDIQLDATPLTLTGEALAVIGGRRTWMYTAGNRRTARELWLRTAHHIGKNPGSATLHTTHVCGQPIPADWVMPPPAPIQRHADTEVPF